MRLLGIFCSVGMYRFQIFADADTQKNTFSDASDADSQKIANTYRCRFRYRVIGTSLVRTGPQEFRQEIKCGAHSQ